MIGHCFKEGRETGISLFYRVILEALQYYAYHLASTSYLGCGSKFLMQKQTAQYKCKFCFGCISLS